MNETVAAKPSYKIDILQMELDQKLPHWLSPIQKNPAPFQAIRDKHRARYLAEKDDARGAQRNKAGFDPSEPRDPHGQWTSGDSGAAAHAEEPAKPDEKPATHEELQDSINRIGPELGYDPSHFTIEDEHPKVDIDGREWNAGAQTNLFTGKIQMFTGVVPQAMADHVVAHEIEHVKFQRALDKAIAERERLTVDEPGGPDDYTDADGRLIPEYAAKYPTLDAMQQALFRYGIEPFARGDGVTNYSKMMWAEFQKGKSDFSTAFHETLAEMAGIKYAKGELPKHWGWADVKPTAKDNAIWRTLYGTVDDIWGKISHEPGTTSATAAVAHWARPDRSEQNAAEDHEFQTEKLIKDGPREGTSRVGTVRDRNIAIWGYSHSGSSAITGWSAKEMGIPGYRETELRDEAQKLGAKFLDAIANGRLSGEKLYHGFKDKQKIDWKIGDTVRLPLMAASGNLHDSAGYGINYHPNADNSGATVFEFPVGTPMAGYSRWDRENTKDFGHTWAEAITAGEFKVSGVRDDHEPGWQKLPIKVVTLAPVRVFDPATKQWREGL